MAINRENPRVKCTMAVETARVQGASVPNGAPPVQPYKPRFGDPSDSADCSEARACTCVDPPHDRLIRASAEFSHGTPSHQLPQFTLAQIRNVSILSNAIPSTVMAGARASWRLRPGEPDRAIARTQDHKIVRVGSKAVHEQPLDAHGENSGGKAQNVGGDDRVVWLALGDHQRVNVCSA